MRAIASAAAYSSAAAWAFVARKPAMKALFSAAAFSSAALASAALFSAVATSLATRSEVVSHTYLLAPETPEHLVFRLLIEHKMISPFPS